MPSGSLVTASPAQIDSGDELLYRFRSRLADGTLTTVTTDNWTLTFTCQSASYCGDQVYTYSATPSISNGNYFVKARPSLGGVYDVLVTMENAATDADQNINTVVSENEKTLTIVDTTTVPSFCTAVASDTTGDIVRPVGSTFTYTM